MNSIKNARFALTWSVLVFACFGFGLTSRAQELGLATAQNQNVVKVTAIAQYIEGRVIKTDRSGPQTGVVYQTAVYEGDRVETSAGSTAKFNARNGCIFVLRGEGAIAAPVDKKPWRMRAENLRVICSTGASEETFGIVNAPLVMREGEVLFLSERSDTAAAAKRVMLLKGAATFLGQPLERHKLYLIQGPHLIETPVKSESELRRLNLDAKPPREADIWPEANKPEPPEKPKTVRLIFGPVFGADRVSFDKTNLSQGGLTGISPRLQLHFRTADDRSVIVSATARETKDKSQESSSNSPRLLGVSNSIEHQLLEAGYRSHHDRWWSPFWRIGAGVSKAKIGYAESKGYANSYTRYSYDFYVLSATYGIDTHLTPKFLSPFGFYASAEGQIIQSVGRGGRVNENSDLSGNTAGPPEPWRLTDVNVGVGAGVQYDF